MSVKQNQDTTESGWRKKKKTTQQSQWSKIAGMSSPSYFRLWRFKKQNLRKKKKQSHSPLFVGGSLKKILGEMIKGTIYTLRKLTIQQVVFQARFFQGTNYSHYQPAATVSGCPKLELRDQLLVISRTWKTYKHTWKDWTSPTCRKSHEHPYS